MLSRVEHDKSFITLGPDLERGVFVSDSKRLGSSIVIDDQNKRDNTPNKLEMVHSFVIHIGL